MINFQLSYDFLLAQSFAGVVQTTKYIKIYICICLRLWAFKANLFSRLLEVIFHQHLRNCRWETLITGQAMNIAILHSSCVSVYKNLWTDPAGENTSDGIQILCWTYTIINHIKKAIGCEHFVVVYSLFGKLKLHMENENRTKRIYFEYRYSVWFMILVRYSASMGIETRSLQSLCGGWFASCQDKLWDWTLNYSESKNENTFQATE